MLGDEASESELRERLTAVVRSTPPLMQVLSVARCLDLPDWLVFSGAIYQPMLNHLTGRALDYGIKDYDLGYFDASDRSRPSSWWRFETEAEASRVQRLWRKLIDGRVRWQ
jgi:hypothetical protein